MHIRPRFGFAFLFASLIASVALAGQTAETFKRKVGDREESLGYLLALPKGYNAKKDAKYPVVLFLHGSGERGSDINLVKKHGPPKLVEKGKDLPFIVISPQCPEKTSWNADQLLALIDDVIEKHHGDKDRVICTGLSMGGFGTWSLVSKYPDRFAAAVPICGGGNPAAVAAMKNVPTWVFHGDKDTAVKLEASQKMVDALKAAGGTVEFTIYEGVGHDSWTKAYNDEKLWEWMSKQKRKGEK